MKIKEIKLSKCNARSYTEDDPEGLTLLAKSIKDLDLINRLVLRKKDNEYEVIAGYRRLKALEKLYSPEYDLPEKDYIIVDVDDEEAYLLSLSENTKRLNLSPMDLNKAYLKLNSKGFKDKEIAHILGVSTNRLKRLANLSIDSNKIPENAKVELSKPTEESKFNELHWDKIREEDENIIKDVVDYIIEKEISPRDVPQAIEVIKKKHNLLETEENTDKDENNTSSEDTPIEYSHKGELELCETDNGIILKVKTKREEEEVPINHYLEFLKHPNKFKCYVSFKLKVKPLID